MASPVQIGEKRGSLTILSFVGKSMNSALHSIWEAQCDCGTVMHITTPNFRHKDRSPKCMACACVARGKAREVHGEAKKTRLYSVWTNMKSRCNRPTADNYRWYGAKGIKVCDEWMDYRVFREWALANGYAPHLTIDRIEADKNYEPGNCRWATMQEQVINRDRAKSA